MTDIFETAYMGLEKTEHAGADETEIYCIEGRSLSLIYTGMNLTLQKRAFSGASG